jgi:hypothetical protein
LKVSSAKGNTLLGCLAINAHDRVAVSQLQEQLCYEMSYRKYAIMLIGIRKFRASQCLPCFARQPREIIQMIAQWVYLL